jgi:hypothetical protein
MYYLNAYGHWLVTTNSETINDSAPGTQATGTAKQYQSTGAKWISLN